MMNSPLTKLQGSGDVHRGFRVWFLRLGFGVGSAGLGFESHPEGSKVTTWYKVWLRSNKGIGLRVWNFSLVLIGFRT